MSKSSRKKGGSPPASGASAGSTIKALSPAGGGPRTNLVPALVVAALTAAVYLLALKNDFVNWDDGVYVVHNPHLRPFNGELFRWAFTAFYSSNWHPLTWISHALDLVLWGLNPLGHHLGNVVIHTVNTFLVVTVTDRLLVAAKGAKGGADSAAGRRFPVAALVTGLLFGLHPLHVESVAWVAERKDLLCALFFLLATRAYLGYAQRAEAKSTGMSFLADSRYLATVVYFILALLSKPMAVSFPLVLLILDWYPLARVRSGRWGLPVLEKLPLAALSLASAILTILAQKTKAMEMMEVVPFTTRLLVAAKALLLYLWNVLLPWKLTPFYPYPLDASLSSPGFLLPVLLVVAVTLFLVFSARRQRLGFALWGYYLVTLLPVLGLLQVGAQAMADRYTYLPSLAPFLLLGLVAARGWGDVATPQGSPAPRMAVIALGVILAVAMVATTISQIRVWQNGFTLWSRVIEREPERVPFAYNNRAEILARSGYRDRALADYDRAIALGSSLKASAGSRGGAAAGRVDRVVWEAHNNRGGILMDMGQVESAIAEYDRALALNPSLFQAYNNRGAALAKAGQLDRAAGDYDRAIALNPSFYEAYTNRGEVAFKLGRLEQAVADGEAAVRLAPGRGEGYNVRGMAREKRGETEQALADFSQAILVTPNAPDPYINRGNLLLKKGDKGAALEDFRKACRLGNRSVCELLPGLEK